MMKYGAAYDADGELVGVYSAHKESDLFANKPQDGRIYPIPIGTASSMPFNLEPLRLMIRATIKAERERAQHSGCTTPFGRVDTDAASQLKILGAVVTAQVAPVGWSIDWTMEDNGVVALTAGDMIAVGLAVSAHVDSCHQYGRSLDAALALAPSVPAAYAVVEDAVWPA